MLDLLVLAVIDSTAVILGVFSLIGVMFTAFFSFLASKSSRKGEKTSKSTHSAIEKLATKTELNTERLDGYHKTMESHMEAEEIKFTSFDFQMQQIGQKVDNFALSNTKDHEIIFQSMKDGTKRQLDLEHKINALVTAQDDVGALQVNAEGEVVWTSDTLQSITGFSIEEAGGTEGWMKTVHPDDIERLNKEWAQAIENQTGYGPSAFRIKSKDGAIHPVVANVYILKDEYGNLKGWFANFRRQIS